MQCLLGKKLYGTRDKYSFSLFSRIHFWIAHLFRSFVSFRFSFSFEFWASSLLLLSLPTSSSTMMCFCFCSSPLIITIYVLSAAVMRYAFLLLLLFLRSFFFDVVFVYALECECECVYAHLVPFSLFVFVLLSLFVWLSIRIGQNLKWNQFEKPFGCGQKRPNDKFIEKMKRVVEMKDCSVSYRIVPRMKRIESRTSSQKCNSQGTLTHEQQEKNQRMKKKSIRTNP